MSDIAKISKTRSTHSILCNMKYSDFSEIKKVMAEEFAPEELENNYKLPKILVIGGQTTGKSSVLENITKCHIFPRDSKRCTKSPLRIILNDSAVTSCKITIGNLTVDVDEHEIYKHIQKHFESLEDIVDDEVIVSISKKGYINMELYDLPGIVAYPPERARKTIDLTRKYLNENNSIILCTIPATDNELINHISISLIKEYNRTPDTILVLTMIDRVQDDNLDDLLFERILNRDSETKDLQIPHCFGLKNRNNKDKVKLDNMKEDEDDSIDYIIGTIDNEHKEYKKEVKTLRERLGTSNLIKTIHEKYMTYVTTIWIPKIIAKLEHEAKDVLGRIDNIGYDLTTDIANHIINANIKRTFTNIMITSVKEACCGISLSPDPRYIIKNSKIITERIGKLIGESDVIECICTKTVKDISGIDVIHYNDRSVTNLNLYRYSNVFGEEGVLVDNLIAKIVGAYLEELDGFTRNTVTVYQTLHLYSGVVNIMAVETLLTSLFTSIIENIDDIVISGSELYESKEYDQIRSDLKNKHKTIMSNIKKINKCKI